MYSEKFSGVVVRYLGETTRYGLTKDKLYGIETNEDIVDSEVYDNFSSITVWNDKGHLAEIEEDSYEVIEGVSWWKVVPDKRYVEQY